MPSEPKKRTSKPAWKAARPGSAAARQDSKEELLTVVVFDISADKVRRKVGDICKDYGLYRLQWSAFEGPLTRNRREELWARLVKMIQASGDGGRLAIFPIGAREAAWATRLSAGSTNSSTKRSDELATKRMERGGK